MKKAKEIAVDKVKKQEDAELVKEKRTGRGKAAIAPMAQEVIPEKKSRGGSKEVKPATKDFSPAPLQTRGSSKGKKVMDVEPPKGKRDSSKSKDKKSKNTEEEQEEEEDETEKMASAKKGAKGKKAVEKKETVKEEKNKKADDKKEAAKGAKKGASAEEEEEWVIKTIEDKLTPTLSSEILGLLEECVKKEFVSYKGEDDTGFEDIGNEKEKQNIEKKIGTALRKRLNAGSSQRMNVVIGETFIVRLTNIKDFGVYMVGPIKVYIFGAVRASGKG